MSIVINNSNQVSNVNVIVQGLPASVDSDLKFLKRLDAVSLNDNLPGTIFGNDEDTGSAVNRDAVAPRGWYHGGRNLISLDDLRFYGDSLLLSNSEINVVSGEREKGLYEIKYGSWINLLDVDVYDDVLDFEIGLGDVGLISVGDYIEVRDLVSSINPNDNTFQVINVDLNGRIVIRRNGISGDNLAFGYGVSVGVSKIRKIEYVWDEIYTTPLGLYKPVSGTASGYYEMSVSGSELTQLRIIIEDNELVIPKTGDRIVMKRFFGDLNFYGNRSGSDEINNMKLFRDSEMEIYEIISQTLISSSGTRSTYVITVDKPIVFVDSFVNDNDNPSGYAEKYFVVLLNRDGLGNKELFTDTFELNEIHRQQLLGDPFVESDPNEFRGRSNHYNYNNGHLGLRYQFGNLLNSNNTPFICLDIKDKIIDRISNEVDSFELHLPNVMLQGDVTFCTLGNSGVNLSDDNGIGTYAGLYLKDGSNKRFGWVLYDWRVVLIDDGELATALMYNSGRNYTLPAPILDQAGNNRKNWNGTNPLVIDDIVLSATLSTPTRVITAFPHSFVNGQEVKIEQVLGLISINTDTNNIILFAKPSVDLSDPLRQYKLDLFSDNALTIPFVTYNGSAYVGGGIIYRNTIDYDYFLTYRIKSQKGKSLPYSDIIPFNFETSGLINNVDGSIAVTIPQLTHLSEYDVLTDLVTKQGFTAEEFEIIIGKYEVDILDPTLITGYSDIYVMPSVGYTFGVDETTYLKQTGEQLTIHRVVYSKSDYNNEVSSGINFYALCDNSTTTELPNIIGTSVNYIYNLAVIPGDLFVGRNKWLLGNVKYKEAITTYRLTFDLTIPAANWNGTTNPSFDITENLISDKLISEIAFLIEGADFPEGVNPNPYVYCKINPPIRKNNTTDINVTLFIDF